jgi:hypothetical protein
MTGAEEPVHYHPVFGGVKAGDRIVIRGSFLIDAETRLNPSAGSIYFGGSGSDKAAPSGVTTRPSTPEDPDAETKAALAKLGPQDRALAEAQRLCPVTGKPLGSMGTPTKVMVKGQPVFLCCEGCEDEAKTHEGRTLEKMNELKTKKPKP